MGELNNLKAIIRKYTDNWLHADDVVKLCSVPRTGVNRDVNLTDAIRIQIRDKLAAYEGPRIVEYIEVLLLSTTDKVKRKDFR